MELLGPIVIGMGLVIACSWRPGIWRMLVPLTFIVSFVWLQTVGSLPGYTMVGNLVVALAASIMFGAVGVSLGSLRRGTGWLQPPDGDRRGDLRGGSQRRSRSRHR